MLKLSNSVKLNLDNVTLVGFAFGKQNYWNQLIGAYKRFNTKVKFAKKIIFVSKVKTIADNKFLKDENIEIIELAEVVNLVHLAEFMIKKLDDYITTDFVINFQDDGFIINPAAWTNEFFSYDYIGAVWTWHSGRRVGNGGFSLRSKKLLTALKTSNLSKTFYPEDAYICRTHRKFLEEKFDIKFAPEPLANRFSVESMDLNRINPSFGFHGKHHMKRISSYIK